MLQIDDTDVAEDIREVEDFHILFDHHEIIWANGAEAESLHTGPEALKSLPSGHHARLLARRHARHGKPLVTS